jgi:hypothetical protein
MIKKKPTKKYAKKKAVKKISGVHKDTKSHNVKINVLSGVNEYINKVNKGILILEKEIKYISTQIKTTKEPLLKKSLVNRKKYLLNELKIGKQLLKKF